MLNKIKALGCDDNVKIMMAYQTYLELTEIEHLTNVLCKYNVFLNVIYITAVKNNQSQVYVPIHSSCRISPTWIQNFQNELSTNKPKSIILVIHEGDSTSVQYSLTEGLIPPPSHSSRRLKENRKKKKLSHLNSNKMKYKVNQMIRQNHNHGK